MKKLLYSLLAVLLVQLSYAAFTPYSPAAVASTPAKETPIAGPSIQSQSVEEFEKITGKKLNRIQRWKFKMIQKRAMRGQAGILPYREELSEGFQALPFFGTLLTGGLVALIMVFTARDRNAMRWASFGITVLALALSVLTLLSY